MRQIRGLGWGRYSRTKPKPTKLREFLDFLFLEQGSKKSSRSTTRDYLKSVSATTARTAIRWTTDMPCMWNGLLKVRNPQRTSTWLYSPSARRSVLAPFSMLFRFSRPLLFWFTPTTLANAVSSQDQQQMTGRQSQQLAGWRPNKS